MSRLGGVKRWMYRDDRPHRLAALLNRGWAIVASAGLGPNRLATLEVRGRRSGRLISFPVMVADYRGERYLVSMLGVNGVRSSSFQPRRTPAGPTPRSHRHGHAGDRSAEDAPPTECIA